MSSRNGIPRGDPSIKYPWLDCFLQPQPSHASPWWLRRLDTDHVDNTLDACRRLQRYNNWEVRDSIPFSNRDNHSYRGLLSDSDPNKSCSCSRVLFKCDNQPQQHRTLGAGISLRIDPALLP